MRKILSTKIGSSGTLHGRRLVPAVWKKSAGLLAKKKVAAVAYQQKSRRDWGRHAT